MTQTLYNSILLDLLEPISFIEDTRRSCVSSDTVQSVFETVRLPIMSCLKSLIFQAFSNLLPHRNRAKSDEQSWYPVLNSYRWVHFIKHPLINNYKGYFPCLQRSCSNFLRSTCPYTEYQLSFAAGSMPYGGYSCRLQLLFVVDYSLT